MIYPSNISTGINLQATPFLTLPSTFATIESVIEEGLFVNVSLDMHLEGQTVLTKIPLIKLPYLNIPVREGDKVFLTKANHLLNEYFTLGEFTNDTPTDSYIAIQCILEPDFKENEFTNHFTLINPEKSFKWLLNDKESTITAEEISETKIYKSSSQTYKENLTVSIENSLKAKITNDIGITSDSYKLEAQTNIINNSQTIENKASTELKLNAPSIDLGSEGVKLGSLIQQLCEALASSQCIVTSGSSAGSYISLSNAGQITAIGSQISSVFK